MYNNWTTVRKINTTKHCNLNLRRSRIYGEFCCHHRLTIIFQTVKSHRSVFDIFSKKKHVDEDFGEQCSSVPITSAVDFSFN